MACKNDECDWMKQKELIQYRLDKFDAVANEALSAKRLVWPFVISVVVMIVVSVSGIIAVVQLFKH